MAAPAGRFTDSWSNTNKDGPTRQRSNNLIQYEATQDLTPVGKDKPVIKSGTKGIAISSKIDGNNIYLETPDSQWFLFPYLDIKLSEFNWFEEDDAVGRPCVVIDEAIATSVHPALKNGVTGRLGNVFRNQARVHFHEPVGWKTIHVNAIAAHVGRLHGPNDTNKSFVAMHAYDKTKDPKGQVLCPGVFDEPKLRINLKRGDRGTIVSSYNSTAWAKVKKENGETGFVPTNYIVNSYLGCKRKRATAKEVGRVFHLNENVSATPFDDDRLAHPSEDNFIALPKGESVIVRFIYGSGYYVNVGTFRNPKQNGYVPRSHLDAGFAPRSDREALSKETFYRIKGGFSLARFLSHGVEQRPSTHQPHEQIAFGEKDFCQVLREMDSGWAYVWVWNRGKSTDRAATGFVPSSFLSTCRFPVVVNKGWGPAMQYFDPASDIEVKQGEPGVLLSAGTGATTPENCVVRIGLPYHASRLSGSVPFNYLTVGGPRNFSEWSMKIVAAPTSGPGRLIPGQSVLWNTIYLLASDLSAGLEGLPPDTSNLWRDSTARIAFTEKMIKCMKSAGSLSTVESNDFNAHDLIAACQSVKMEDIKRDSLWKKGIYLRLYNVPTGTSSPPGWHGYSGKTVNFYNRDASHRSDTRKSTRAPHYKVARAAGQDNTFVLGMCFFSDDPSETFLSAAEQIITCLLNTYRPEFGSSVDIDDALMNTLKEDVEIEVMNWVSEEEGISADSGLAITKDDDFLGRTWKQIRAADKILTIARGVFEKTGWKCSLGCKGLNINSALFERLRGANLPNCWSMIDRTTYWEFQRSPMVVQRDKPKGSPQMCLILGRSSKPGAVRLEQPWTLPCEFKTGDQIFLVVEIYKNGPHPQSWSTLPGLGCWSDWEEARSVGMKLRWKKDGKWYEYRRHDRAPSPQNLLDEGQPGSSKSYAMAIGLRRELLGLVVDETRPWFPAFATPDVYQIRKNHLDQSVTLQLRGRTNSPASRSLSMGQLQTILRNAGAGRVDGFGELPDDYYADSTKVRPFCDCCVLNGLKDSAKSGRDQRELSEYKNVSGWAVNTFKCVRHGNTDQCQRCWVMRQPCSYTRWKDLRRNGPLQLLLMRGAPASEHINEGEEQSVFDSFHEAMFRDLVEGLETLHLPIETAPSGA